jgi:outer membrane protein, heavy metal efflux system
MKQYIRPGMALCLAVLFSSSATAQPDHELLRASPSLNFESVYQAALTAAPEAPANTDRKQLAESYIALGERWITNRPSWQTSYIDDGLLDDIGQREMEAGVSVNLWRPGERSQAQNLGSSYQQKAQAWERHFNWLIAGRVRMALADNIHAETLLMLEGDATREAERLLEITTSLFESGAVPELDVLQVRSLLLEQREIELGAQANLVDANRNYTVLTNLNMQPSEPHREHLSTLEEIPLSHPYLNLLRSEIDLAQANIEQAKRTALGSPSLTLGVRRERGIQQQAFNDSFGVTVNVPFGGSAAVSASTSSARSNKVDTEIRFAKVLQQLTAELHEIEHELYLIEQTLELALERSEISQRHWEMSRAAFAAGETTLAQVVLAQQRALSSSKKMRLLELEKQRRITEYNQVVGETP